MCWVKEVLKESPMPETRRFPPPWSVEETIACFIVRDRDGQALAYVYFDTRSRNVNSMGR